MDTGFWCAWCDEPVDEPTILNSLPFHWICLKRRMQARREERDARARPRKPGERIKLRRLK